MAFSFLNSTQTAGASPLTITIPSVPAGTLLVIGMKVGGTGATGVFVTDNASIPNTYAVSVAQVGNGSTVNISQYYGVAVTGGATSVILTWVGPAARVTVDQFSGGNSTNGTIFDKGIGNAAPTTTSASVALSPTSAGELIVAHLGCDGSPTFITVGSGYTFGTNNTSSSSEYKLSGTTSETAPFTWTNVVSYAEVAGAFIASSGSTVPTAPTIGTATAGNTAATVTFSTSSSDGGSAITSYTATSSPGSFTRSVSGATASPIIVSGLTNGTAYTFTVHATNSIGNSAESSASNSVTPSGSFITGSQYRYSEQEILNLMYGSTPLTKYSPQGIANLQAGQFPTQQTFRERLNIKLGVAPSTYSRQVALFLLLQSALALSGNPYQYSEQQLLNMAYNNSIPITTIL